MHTGLQVFISLNDLVQHSLFMCLSAASFSISLYAGINRNDDGFLCACKQIFMELTFCRLNGFASCRCIFNLVWQLACQSQACLDRCVRGRECNLNVEMFLYIFNSLF